jgi:hypothetical protein
MKTLFKTLKIIIVCLLFLGVYNLYQINERLQQEQHAAALEQCKKNNFEGWVKLAGDFSVYRCKADTKTIEVI